MAKPLTFNVGPYVYRLFYVDDLRDVEGTPCWGLCDANRYEILIDTSAKPEQRLVTLVHELSHAWDFAVGAPRDDEAVAERMACVHLSLSRDIERQADRVDDLRDLGVPTMRATLECMDRLTNGVNLTAWFAAAGRKGAAHAG